jgi:hypothetical protein
MNSKVMMTTHNIVALKFFTRKTADGKNKAAKEAK